MPSPSTPSMSPWTIGSAEISGAQPTRNPRPVAAVRATGGNAGGRYPAGSAACEVGAAGYAPLRFSSASRLAFGVTWPAYLLPCLVR